MHIAKTLVDFMLTWTEYTDNNILGARHNIITIVNHRPSFYSP